MYKLNQIPSETQIKKYLRRILFGKNIFCPKCKSQRVEKYEARYRCKKCRLKFSLLSFTWLANMKISFQKFWLILWCWTTQVPVKQAVVLTHLSEKGIRHWYDLFRAHLPANSVVLERVVQLDEAYFRKMSLIMAKQPGTRKLAWQLLKAKSVQRHHATYFLQSYVKPKSKLYTDGASIYRNINQWWPVKHTRDLHKKFEFDHTSEIEGTFGVLRTFIRRMYHHVTADKLEEIIREFCFRFSFPEMFNNPRFYLEKSLRLVPTG